MNTLKGVFPEPRPIPKRNFVKENVMHIKRMQGLAEDPKGKVGKGSKTQVRVTSPSKIMKYIHETRKELESYRKSATSHPNKSNVKPNSPVKKRTNEKTGKKKMENTAKQVLNNRKTDTIVKQILDSKNLKESAIQTEDFSDITELYSTGTIKYPSSHIISALRGKKAEQDKTNLEQDIGTGEGDYSTRAKTQEVKRLSKDSKKDYIRENIEVLKNSTVKQDTPRDPYVAPPSYQKGVVPKYIKERKELLKHSTEDLNEIVPEGHVSLPENERKETLKMLRQSYSNLITELNKMPVRSDTLKLRNRKIYIEDQLKKLDEGMKIFSRPKVFVKVDS